MIREPVVVSPYDRWRRDLLPLLPSDANVKTCDSNPFFGDLRQEITRITWITCGVKWTFDRPWGCRWVEITGYGHNRWVFRNYTVERVIEFLRIVGALVEER